MELHSLFPLPLLEIADLHLTLVIACTERLLSYFYLITFVLCSAGRRYIWKRSLSHLVKLQGKCDCSTIHVKQKCLIMVRSLLELRGQLCWRPGPITFFFVIFVTLQFCFRILGHGYGTGQLTAQAFQFLHLYHLHRELFLLTIAPWHSDCPFLATPGPPDASLGLMFFFVMLLPFHLYMLYPNG